jgi:NAD-dependent SIR2 family protein deacetylase
LVVLVSGFIFFSVEESAKAGLLRKSRVALAQNNAIKSANDKLEEAQQLLQKEEDSLVDMYTQWLDEDHDTLELDEKQVTELKEQLKAVKEQLDEHGEVIDDKEASLEEKEQRLKAYQFKIQQKSDYLQQMADVLAKLNATKPQGLAFGESPEEYVWDDEAAVRTGSRGGGVFYRGWCNCLFFACWQRRRRLCWGWFFFGDFFFHF